MLISGTGCFGGHVVEHVLTLDSRSPLEWVLDMNGLLRTKGHRRLDSIDSNGQCCLRLMWGTLRGQG